MIERSSAASSGREPGWTSGTRISSLIESAACTGRERRRDQLSGVIFFALTSAPHFSVSRLSIAASSCGDDAEGTAPLARSFSLIAGVASVLRTASFSALMTAGGVFAGANSAYQLLVSTP